jgi:hypothetical protein
MPKARLQEVEHRARHQQVGDIREALAALLAECAAVRPERR